MLYINPDNPQPRLIKQASDALKQGAVICYPTDTVYGIGCDIYNQKAVKRIYQIKRRPKNKPFSFMCSGLKNVSEYCFLSNTAYRLMKKCLPGAYTFVLPAMKIVPKIMMSKQKTVGIRVPDNAAILALARMIELPITTTSANISGRPTPYTMQEIIDQLEDSISQVALILDQGQIPSGSVSTIVDLTVQPPQILRQGLISNSEISRVLGSIDKSS